MRLRIRAHKGLTGPLRSPRPRPQARPRRHPRDRVLHPDPPADRRRPRPGPAPARDPAPRSRPSPTRAGSTAAAAATLAEAYVEHRTLEHRLQMLDDAQTQRLPEDAGELARLADFCGAPDSRDLRGHARSPASSTVHGADRAVLRPRRARRRTPRARAGGLRRPRRRRGHDRRTGRACRRSAASAPAPSSGASSPSCMRRIAGAASPDARARLARRLPRRGLPAGVQIFSLMRGQPAAARPPVDICGTAPELARHLGSDAGVLDAVISRDFYRPLRGASELARRPRRPAAPGRRLRDGAQRRAHLDEGAAFPHRRAPPARPRRAPRRRRPPTRQSPRPCSPRSGRVVTAEFATAPRRRRPAPGAAVVAMGKLGSREMTVSSDLDLIVIYDAAGAEASDGRRPLAAPVYYARLTQALIAALTAPMAEGMLYKVDMRLRPSGRQGPVATALPSFRRYQAEEAWTWEHLALTRARVVAGPRAVARAVAAAIAEVLAAPARRREGARGRRDMRRRLAEAHEAAAANPWEVKLGPGRMMDIELLAQTGALIHDLARPAPPAPDAATARRSAGWTRRPGRGSGRGPRPPRHAAAARPPRQRPHHRPGRGRRRPRPPRARRDRRSPISTPCATASPPRRPRCAAIIAARLARR